MVDLFGCHFEAIETGRMVYLDPKDELCNAAIAPQRYLCQNIVSNDNSGLIRLRALVDDSPSEALATLNIPYGHPAFGSIEGKDWSSIHSSPPWTDTGIPALVRHRVGKGRVIYSAADIESGEGAAHERLFVSLLRDLMPCPMAFEADAHPSVWMTVFDQPDRHRQVVNLLNYANELPLVPGRAGIKLNPPPGYRFTNLEFLPSSGAPPKWRVTEDGTQEFELESLGVFTMLAATYEKING